MVNREQLVYDAWNQSDDRKFTKEQMQAALDVLMRPEDPAYVMPDFHYEALKIIQAALGLDS